jgi:hypothetical protein
MMPNRLIRDGLLESEAVLSLTIEARWLYIAICLTADDMGLFEATEFRLARRADLKKEHIQRLLSMLNDVDLIRLYSDGKKTFGIIPKFRQRLQIKRIKYPIPPESLYIDDEDAVEKFNKLKLLASKTTDTQQLDSSYVSDAQQSEPEPEPELEPKSNKYKSNKGSRFDLVEIPNEWVSFCKQERPELDPNATFHEFKDYWIAQPSSKGIRADWFATWRNWVRRSFGKNPVSKQGDDKSWMFSNEGIEAKARELGVSDYGVANHFQLKDKILQVMAKKAIQ